MGGQVARCRSIDLTTGQRYVGGMKPARPIAQRELVYLDDAGQEQRFTIKVGCPQADGGFWACDYEIGAPSPFSATAFGEDSLQALVMALHAVQAHLGAPDLKDRVRWLGEPLPSLLELPGVGTGA